MLILYAVAYTVCPCLNYNRISAVFLLVSGLPIPVVAISVGAVHMQYGTDETLVEVLIASPIIYRQVFIV